MKKAKALLATLEDLERYVSTPGVRVEDVSRWSIGKHVEHCLRATLGICSAIAGSEPYRGRIRRGLVRRIILLSGWIPRGRGKAPEGAVPQTEPTASDLRELLAQARKSVEPAALADRAGWWKHFAFGVFPREEALKFAAIHNRHHLRIIVDIVTSAEDETRPTR